MSDYTVEKGFQEGDKVEEGELHTCPYKLEIENDSDSLCTCDDEERNQCMMDI